MTIYSSDYNARTRELVNDRGQRSREVAVSAAAQIISAAVSPSTRDTPKRIAAQTLKIAQALDTFIQTGVMPDHV